MRYRNNNRQRKPYDFVGWATKHNIKCSDGRTIREGAFADQNGEEVPMVWMHQGADDINNVIGHCKLQYNPEGVIAYGVFNNTPNGKTAKELVEHGDITHLSIRANKLQQTPRGDVLHGTIREVSLVVAGANPGANISYPSMTHGDSDGDNDDIIIYWNDFEIVHGEGLNDPYALEDEDMYDDDYAGVDEEYYDDDTDGDEYEEEPDDGYYDDDDDDDEDKDMNDLADIWENMTDEEQEVVLAAIDQAYDDIDAGYYDDYIYGNY